jgi:glycerophosphoryl diester phosphodiesterase
MEDLLDLQVRPFAIAHHGFGSNLGEDPSRPIENTLPAIRRGFRTGAAVVEVDVQLTKDGHVVLNHDDFLLPSFACLNQLTLYELRAAVPEITTLAAALEVTREVNRRADVLGGLMIVELKAPSPLCDPDDTSERALVHAVTGVIRRAHMTQQVMINSFSPALLLLMQVIAPEIPRDLGVTALQFLTPAEVATATGLPVTLIDKKIDVGLQWAEIGQLFRLPGYRSPDEAFATAAAVGARVVEVELQLLEATGAPFVGALRQLGYQVLGFTATNPAEWSFLDSLDLDGIYVDDVPFGVANEATLPGARRPRHGR